MSGTVIASEAKLVVRLDTVQAERDYAEWSKKHPAVGTGEAIDEPTGPSADAKRSRAARDRREPDAPFDANRPGREIFRVARGVIGAAAGGHLYEQGLGLVRTVPIAGTIAAAAELIREYGPEGAGLASSLAQRAGVPSDIAKQALDAAMAAVAGLNDVRIELNSIGAGIQYVKAVGAALGRADGTIKLSQLGDLTEFGLTMRQVEKAFATLDARRDAHIKQRVGGAIGNLIGEAAESLGGAWR